MPEAGRDSELDALEAELSVEGAHGASLLEGEGVLLAGEEDLSSALGQGQAPRARGGDRAAPEAPGAVGDRDRAKGVAAGQRRYASEELGEVEAQPAGHVPSAREAEREHALGVDSIALESALEGV